MKTIVIALIRLYQWTQPFRSAFARQVFGTTGTCRYRPTCSDYWIHAVKKYGAFRGSYMGITRVMRCHPFAEGGYDPVK